MTTTEWKFSNAEEQGNYLGIIEIQSNDGEHHNFEVMSCPDRLVFGGACNVGFLESGYILNDGFSVDETLQALVEDLETYYNDGPSCVGAIVCNERM
jgi:hypothetical protein